MSVISFSTVSVGVDADNDGVPDNDADGNANTIIKSDLVSSTNVDMQRVITIVGSGDTVLDTGETGYVVSRRGSGARATSLSTDNTVADPVLIRGNGIVSGSQFGDLTPGVRYSKTTGFGLDNGPDGEKAAKILNNGDALTFEVTGGQILTSVQFTVDAANASATVALDADNETLGDGQYYSSGAIADLAVVVIDFQAQTITVNGVSVAPPSDYFAAFATAGGDKFTIGSPLGQAGFSIVDLRLTTAPPADPSVTANPDSYTGVEDQALTVAAPGVLANDSGALSAALVSGPAHGTLTFSSTGSFVYTPNANYNGADTFIYHALNGTGGTSVDTTVSISIAAVNDAPVLSAPLEDQTATEGVSFNFVVPSGAFTDVDTGDTLAYAARLQDGGALPSWLSFDAATHTFTGAPGGGDVGTLNVVVTATDQAGVSAGDVFQLTVSDANAPPVVAQPLADVTAHAGQAFFAKIPAGAFTDAGGPLTYTATLADGSDLPSWLTFDPASGRFAGLAPSAQGSLDVKVTATDQAGLSVSDAFAITIDEGRIFDARDYGAVANDFLDDTAAIQAAINAAASGGGGTVILGPGTYLVSGTSTPSDGAIRLLTNTSMQGAGMGETVLKLQDGWSGDLTGIVRTPTGAVTNNVGLFDLTIDGNRANVTGKVDGFFCGVSPDDPRHSENVIVQNVEVMNNGGYGYDPHEQTWGLFILDCVSHGNGLDGFVADYIVEGLYQNNIAYGNDRHGFNVCTSSYDLRLVDNVAYGNGSTGFTVQRGSYDIPLAHDIDIIGGMSFGNAQQGVRLVMSNNLSITGLLIEQNGRQGILAQGVDGLDIVDCVVRNNSQSGNNAYDQITLQDRDDTAVSGNIFLTSNVIVSGSQIVADGAVLPRYGVRVDVDGSDYVSVIDNRMFGFLAPTSIGAAHYTIQANDLSADQAPFATTSLTSGAATEDQAFVYILPASLFSDGDAGDQVVVSVRQSNGAPLPSWLIYDPINHTLSGTPTNRAVGALNLTVVGTDASGLAGGAALTINVANVNDAPIVLNPAPDRIVGAGGQFSQDFAHGVFLDVDLGDTLSFAATLDSGAALPSWLSMSAAGVLSGSPGTGDVGIYNLLVTVHDAAGLSAQETVSIDVRASGLYGTPYADVLVGGVGADSIYGLSGADTITGNAGADTFVLRLGDASGEVIADFEGANASGGDVLLLVGFGADATLAHSGDMWTVTGSSGSATFQIANVTALNSSDYVVDADPLGSAAFEVANVTAWSSSDYIFA